jgi:hypothetical protein
MCYTTLYKSSASICLVLRNYAFLSPLSSIVLICYLPRSLQHAATIGAFVRFEEVVHALLATISAVRPCTFLRPLLEWW